MVSRVFSRTPAPFSANRNQHVWCREAESHLDDHSTATEARSMFIPQTRPISPFVGVNSMTTGWLSGSVRLTFSDGNTTSVPQVYPSFAQT
jgi:hypothetical protein